MIGLNDLIDDDIEEKEEELFLADIETDRLLVLWRKGGYSDNELITMLKMAKKHAHENATTVLVDERNEPYARD